MTALVLPGPVDAVPGPDTLDLRGMALMYGFHGTLFRSRPLALLEVAQLDFTNAAHHPGYLRAIPAHERALYCRLVADYLDDVVAEGGAYCVPITGRWVGPDDPAFPGVHALPALRQFPMARVR